MNKEVISNKQGLSILIMYTTGSAIILAPWRKAGIDGWIAIIMAMVMIFPMIIVYSRLVRRFPEKDLYDLQEEVFGKLLGKIISFFIVTYSIHIGSLIIRDFTEFIQVLNFTETPMFPIAMMLGVLAIWVVKAGIEVLGRWCAFILPLVIITFTTASLLLIPKMDYKNIMPVMYNGFTPVFNGAIATFSFPFAEIFLFTIVFKSINDKDKVFKVFFLNILITGLILIATSVRNILTLGGFLNEKFYFPAYIAISVVNIKDFIDRIEVVVGGNFVFLGFVKLSICLYSACIGISKIFNIKNYRNIVSPVGLMIIIISVFVHKNTMELFEWPAENYTYYIIPYAIILPVITLIVSEIKLRKNKNNKDR